MPRHRPRAGSGISERKGRVEAEGRGGGIRRARRMCSLGRANVFSFWPNVFTFGPDVFSLAAECVQFWGDASLPEFSRTGPGISPCAREVEGVRGIGRQGKRGGGSTGSPGMGMGPGPTGLSWNAGDQVEPPPTHGRGIAVGKNSPPGRLGYAEMPRASLVVRSSRPIAFTADSAAPASATFRRRSGNFGTTGTSAGTAPAGRDGPPSQWGALHTRIARTGAVPSMRWFRAHECLRRGVHRSRRVIGSDARRIGDYRRLLDHALWDRSPARRRSPPARPHV